MITLKPSMYMQVVVYVCVCVCVHMAEVSSQLSITLHVNVHMCPSSNMQSLIQYPGLSFPDWHEGLCTHTEIEHPTNEVTPDGGETSDADCAVARPSHPGIESKKRYSKLEPHLHLGAWWSGW